MNHGDMRKKEQQKFYQYVRNFPCEHLWENQGTENFTNKSTKDVIFEVLKLLDTGEERIAQKDKDSWKINGWLKKEISWRNGPNST